MENSVSEADGVKEALRAKASEIAKTATSYGASFETERTTVWATGEHVGGKTPEYGADVKRGIRGWVGIVMPKNYAAMKDNYLHNTLLRAKG